MGETCGDQPSEIRGQWEVQLLTLSLQIELVPF